ncbi:MAG: hypothetical protein DMD34_04480, partial [Gemmatimonadetes bacterium]
MYDIETPALLLHLDVVERNIGRMADRAKGLGVALRPHAKTHKCVELARQQLEHGAHGLTVSTLVEAEVFARAGVTDLTWAFPIDPSHVAPARRIAEQTGATLRVVVDDQRTARVLAGSGLHVWLKVDCGNHRAGVNPASPYALKVASELGTEQGLVFDGILSHSGHAYRTTNKAEAARVAEQERSVMVGFAGRLREVGLEVRGVSIGSCEPGDVGVTVLTTVVSHQPGAGHFIVDAGALALSKDTGPAHVGPQAMGAVRGAPDLVVATLSQEHGLIRGESPAALDGRFAVGTQLEIVPNHSCLTVAHFD